MSTIYARQFKPQKVQSRKLALSLSQVQRWRVDSQGVGSGANGSTFGKVRTFLNSLSEVMLRKPQSILQPPRYRKDVPITGELASTALPDLNHQPISLSLIRLKTWSSSAVQFGYETHVHGEAAVAASLVAAIQFCCPEDDIFVATPHRVQREAVKTALARIKGSEEDLEEEFEKLYVGEGSQGKKRGNITVDTVERLQGNYTEYVPFSVSGCGQLIRMFLTLRLRSVLRDMPLLAPRGPFSRPWVPPWSTSFECCDQQGEDIVHIGNLNTSALSVSFYFCQRGSSKRVCFSESL